MLLDCDSAIAILKSRVFPTLGCTDPVVAAYASSIAFKAIGGGDIKNIVLTVDKNIYKNALRVTIPKTILQGLDYACALGALGGKYKYQLQVLKDINEGDIEKAAFLVRQKLIKVVMHDKSGLFVDVSLETSHGKSRCRIEESYTNVTLIEVNGQRLPEDNQLSSLMYFNIPPIDGLTIDELFAVVEECPIEELSFIEEGYAMNLIIAEEGLKLKGKGFFGKGFKLILEDINLINHVKMLTAAAADMRMTGANYPVMASAGSGNQGITGLVPIASIAKVRKIDREKTIRAATLSHLITMYIKERIGIVSHICGCSVAAGAGASAGVAYLLGGDRTNIANAITNTIGGLAGMICDGAKRGCAFKLSISAGTAVEAALLALEGVVIPADDGIIAADIEKTIENLSYISREGMVSLDSCILDVMNGK